MAPDLDFIDFVVGQMEDAGVITYRMMFGGCTVYCEGKVIALICENQLFVKATKAGKTFIGEVVEAPPYEGAKLAFLIEDQIEDKDWIGNLVRLTERELPAPKPKKKSKRKSKKST